MFHSKEEELRRLEALLLEEDDPTPKQQEEPLETDSQSLPEEDTYMPADDPGFYRNYANNYTVYNSDRTDISPEEMSRQLEAPQRDWINISLALLAGVELLAILAVLALFYL